MLKLTYDVYKKSFISRKNSFYIVKRIEIDLYPDPYKWRIYMNAFDKISIQQILRKNVLLIILDLYCSIIH